VLSFTYVYFSESSLFNGLQASQAESFSLCFSIARSPLTGRTAPSAKARAAPAASTPRPDCCSTISGFLEAMVCEFVFPVSPEIPSDAVPPVSLPSDRALAGMAARFLDDMPE
jgi:hypothetical protein